jgi:hypothetical protein
MRLSTESQPFVQLLHTPVMDHDDAWGQFIDLDDEEGELVDRRAKFLSIRNLLTIEL